MDVLSALSSALALLAPNADVVAERPDDGDVPTWSDRRGWTEHLLSLGDPELAACEIGDPAPFAKAGVPASLAELARAAGAIARLPRLGGAPRLAPRRRIGAHKLPQIGALLAAMDPLARAASRIVDVGAGRGHLTRAASERFAKAALGIDRHQENARGADAASDSPAEAARVVFLVREIADPTDVPLETGDLALGLHACGALGDRLVVAAARVGCDVALVGCCAQKVPGDARIALSRAAAGWSVARAALGLANLAARADGVEVPLDETLRARAARLALRSLLAARGVNLAAGDEMRGINRRRARAGLEALAAAALAARGLPGASPAELAHHAAEGARRFARARRLSLPRNLLARPLEIAIALDRAAALVDAGLAARVAVLPDVPTPRDVVILASRDPTRLLR